MAAWDQPCFLNTRLLSVNENARTHGALAPAPAPRFSWPGAPRPASSLQMAGVRILKTREAGAGAPVSHGGPSDSGGATMDTALSHWAPHGIPWKKGCTQGHLWGNRPMMSW